MEGVKGLAELHNNIMSMKKNFGKMMLSLNPQMLGEESKQEKIQNIIFNLKTKKEI